MQLTRRQLVLGGLAAGAAGAAAVALEAHPWHHLAKAAVERPLETSPSSGILVLVTLQGGNDGVNTLIPLDDSRYLAARGALAYKGSEALPLADGFGLHPQLEALKGMWDAGQLAVVRGVGYPDPNRSHFRSMDIWQSAVPEHQVVSGWLGRWLDANGADPLRAISVGSTVPLALVGERTAGTAVPTGSFVIPGGERVGRAFMVEQVPAVQPSPLAELVARSGADLVTASAAISKVTQAPAKPAGGAGAGGAGTPAAPPGGQLGTQLDLVAKLINGNVPAHVYSDGLGRFDTHANQKDAHAKLLGDLDAALHGFFAAIAPSPHAGDVTVMTFSEFGRRVAANASGGTDHGAAAPLFVAGRRVKGGFYGDAPSMADLDSGDLKHTVDFRSVYSTILSAVLGADPAAIIPGGPFPPVSFL
jgi:uncharacterized protein (DUF1501 family)